LTLIDDDLLFVEVELSAGVAVLHTRFRRRFSSMRAARREIHVVCKRLRDMGYERVWVGVPETDTMLARFVRSFGFDEFLKKSGLIFFSKGC